MNTSLSQYVITTFYKFTKVDDCYDLRVKFIRFCVEQQIKGTILLASEGINATLIGKRKAIDLLYLFIRNIDNFADIQFQETFTQTPAFQKLKVKVKKEIVAFKRALGELNPGQHLSPSDWDKLVVHSTTLVIDTRNKYEVAIGTFLGAINPNINNFSELAPWLDHNLKQIALSRPIAMFCTGGIRCEKSTAYLKNHGYKNVYHLKGGIINYLRNTQNRSNIWRGQCFVFDNRTALNSNLQPVKQFCKG